jgi:hypothetical protein
MSKSTFKKVDKVYEILCLPCLKIYGGGCSEHPQCDKYCNYCTESGCDFNICSERLEDEELIFQFEESRKTDPEFPCPQVVALAYEKINDMYQRGRILSEVKGLKGLQFLEKVKNVLENPIRESYSVPTIAHSNTASSTNYSKKNEHKSDISICLDCPGYVSRKGNYWCDIHKEMKNRCLTCRNHGHIYYDCAMWISARDTLSSSNEDKEDAKKIIIHSLTRLYIVQTLKMKGCQHAKNDMSYSNMKIIENAIDNAFLTFESGRY